MSIKYNVNEEKRTVTAYVEDGYCDILNGEVKRIVLRVGGYNLWARFIEYRRLNQVLRYGTAFEQAHCFPTDAWNEELGCALAQSRLIKALALYKAKLLDCFYAFLVDQLNYVSDETEKAFDKANFWGKAEQIHLSATEK